MEDKIEQKKCEICKDKATNICFDCSFYLCDDCFKFIHEKKTNHDHKKENIDLFSSLDLKCREHPKIPMSLFCVEEKSKYILIII